MVKYCLYSSCKNYGTKPNMEGVFFVPVPKPSTEIEMCEKWLQAINRPNLTPQSVSSHHYVCSKHFVGENGPTTEFPVPLPDQPTDQVSKSQTTYIKRKKQKMAEQFFDGNCPDGNPDPPSDHAGYALKNHTTYIKRNKPKIAEQLVDANEAKMDCLLDQKDHTSNSQITYVKRTYSKVHPEMDSYIVSSSSSNTEAANNYKVVQPETSNTSFTSTLSNTQAENNSNTVKFKVRLDDSHISFSSFNTQTENNYKMVHPVKNNSAATPTSFNTQFESDLKMIRRISNHSPIAPNSQDTNNFKINYKVIRLERCNSSIASTSFSTQSENNYKQVGKKNNSPGQSNISPILAPTMFQNLAVQYSNPNNSNDYILPSNDHNVSETIEKPSTSLSVLDFQPPLQPIKLEVIEEVIPDEDDLPMEQDMETLQSISNCLPPNSTGPGDFNQSQYDVVLTNLDELYEAFVQYQIECNQYLKFWIISRSGVNDSLYIYNTVFASEIGYSIVEIKPNFEIRILVHGKPLDMQHKVMCCEYYPKFVFSTNDLVNFLIHLRLYKVCSGIFEEEIVSKIDEKTVRHGFLNRSTNAWHSNKCERFHNLKLTTKCYQCASYKILLRRRIVRNNKAVARPVGKGFNVRFMTDNQLEIGLNNLSEERKALKKQVSQLTKKKLKLEEKMKNLPDILLKIKDANNSNDNILQCIIKQHVNCRKLLKSRPRIWDPITMKWCHTLVRISSTAYVALKKILILPSIRTLGNFTSEFPIRPGYSDLVVEELKRAIDVSSLEEYQKYFSLVVVEMKECLTDDDDKVASIHPNDQKGNDSQMMVLVIAGLITHFKQIIAYFPSLKMEPHNRAKVIQDGIELLENNGFKILTVICDSSLVYQEVIKLCADFDIEKNIAYKIANPFTPRNEQRDIYYMCDPPEIMKMVRNCLFHSGANKCLYFYQRNGKFILWSHVRDMFKKDNEARFRMCPKLTDNHVKLGITNSTRVNFALQILSNSVANAIEKVLSEDTSETVTFIRFFNRFFDLCNTRSYNFVIPSRNTELDPYTSECDWRLAWLEDEFGAYLREWISETENADVINEEKMKMCLTKEIHQPIFQTVHSIVGATKFLLRKGAPCVLTDKFNRDMVDERYGKFFRADA